MHDETKVDEFRPVECGTRLGDVVIIYGKKWLKIKCRRCTKYLGVDSYHYIEMWGEKDNLVAQP